MNAIPAFHSIFVFLAGASSVLSADWPIWRGLAYDGVSAEKNWQLSGDPKVLWEAEVGLGFSSFVVSNGRVLTTGHADDQDTVFCLDAKTGKEIWKHTYPADLGDKYYEGGTSATPTFDGDKAYHLSRWGDLFCFEAATGKVVWEKNVQKETGANIPDWGFAGAPLVQGELLILNVGKAGMAVEKASGKIVWKSEVDAAGYSTPYPITWKGSKLAVIGSADAYVAVDVKTGHQLWTHRWNTRYGVNAADPILSGDALFISSGYNKGCTVLKLGSGDPEKVWENKSLKNMFNSSVLIDGYLYGIDGDQNSRAGLKCVRFSDGQEMWAENIGFGSLMAADGRLIVLSAKGELIIVKAGSEKFDEVSRAQILNGKCWSAPVLANGLLYARNSEGRVVCLDLSK
ncbi:outer membrane protein assembly factor BamB [Prosthecobacter fusiformis]|uniref:Outer membrane protein assembly factor BamB n=1 Tax=Prosthecobacter fusiformis TaxID=48464 RepID=A0A4R7S7Y7_9BACT|nr:PQQ-binding-like beta-propeller repeat protein [Prosthecobacter fusiformis]TDU73377.1 outer membrane protein assembly factor BamB [Prosthecobacter fusiformis]